MREGIVTEQNEAPQQNDSEKMTITEVEDKMESGGQQMPQQENMTEQMNQMQQERGRQLQTPLMMQQESRGPTPQMTEEEMRMDKMRKVSGIRIIVM